MQYVDAADTFAVSVDRADTFADNGATAKRSSIAILRRHVVGNSCCRDQRDALHCDAARDRGCMPHSSASRSHSGVAASRGPRQLAFPVGNHGDAQCLFRHNTIFIQYDVEALDIAMTRCNGTNCCFQGDAVASRYAKVSAPSMLIVFVLIESRTFP